MSHSNPISEDHKLLLVFRNIGLQLLQQLKAVINAPPYNAFFKDVSITDQNELKFSYLLHTFQTGIEVYFNHSKLPKSAQIAIYYAYAGKKEAEEIVSYSFDLNYQVNNVYTLQDFAEPFLIEFHQNLKKSFSDNHVPFALKFNSR